MIHLLGDSPRSFRREARLLKKSDFDRVFNGGCKAVCDAFVLIGKPQDSNATPTGARMGLVVSRKVGNAVTRNRVKRHLRTVFRQERANWQSNPILNNTDMVIIARAAAAQMNADDFERRFKRCWNQLQRRLAKATPEKGTE